MIFYTIKPLSVNAHLFEVTVKVSNPYQYGQIFELPAWIAGSYMIRDFAKQIIQITATTSEGQPIKLTKLNKQRWQAAKCVQDLILTYQVYALDLSVRTAWLDNQRGYFNGTSVFLRVQGQEHLPCQLDIQPPEDETTWRVATSLPTFNANQWDFGLYQADNYQHLIDCPVEMADFKVLNFNIQNIPHYMVISGYHRCDEERFKADLIKICNQQACVFNHDLPLKSYLFLLLVVDDGYGGLEHSDSTSLICNRDDLPVATTPNDHEGYIRLLGLCSHEYFHLWHVKRIKPQVFYDNNLSHEVYTPLLWAFEGFTAYFDDLALVRAGCIQAKDYLNLLAKTITRVLKGTGRLKQSVAESSYDAWTRFYQQDDNAPNAIVSYYAKGSLVALGLDIILRQQGKSLDDLMYLLWLQYGKIGKGIEEHDIQQAAEQLIDQDLSDFFTEMVYGTSELPLQQWLDYFAIEMILVPPKDEKDQGGFYNKKEPLTRINKPTLGARLADKNGKTMVLNTLENSIAQCAGLTTGDELIALDGIRINAKNFNQQLGRFNQGDQIEMIAFRQGILMPLTLTIIASEENCCYLSLIADEQCTEKQLLSRKNWLGETT